MQRLNHLISAKSAENKSASEQAIVNRMRRKESWRRFSDDWSQFFQEMIAMPLNASEASVEAEIKTKGLTAPRLTPADIDAAISGEDYYVFPNTTVTVCALTLRNGFVVIGHSACASRDNFDASIGKRLAYAVARNKIWDLEGYLLREKLATVEEVSMMSEALGENLVSITSALSDAVTP